MSKLTSKQRKAMPDSAFGLPGSRKYPMEDTGHQIAAKSRDGIQALRQYRYEVDEKRGGLRKEPLHDWASHAPDAFRTAVILLWVDTPQHSGQIVIGVPSKRVSVKPGNCL
jgi:hypothetical protein